MTAPSVRWLLLSASLCGAPACGAAPSEPIAADGWGPTSDVLGNPSVVEEKRKPAPRPKTIPVAERKRWALADQVAALQPVAGRGRSEHLDGAFERSVLINDAAAAYLRLVPGIVLPDAALVAQRHHAPDSDAVHSWFVMHKRDGHWQYRVLDAELRVAADDLALCSRCHDDASHDSLFGPPSSDAAESQ